MSWLKALSQQLVPVPPGRQHFPLAISIANSQEGSHLTNNNRQEVSVSQAGRQVTASSNPQGDSANSHRANNVPQAGNSQAVSASPQNISMASQAVGNSQAGSQSYNSNRQAVSINIISTSQAGRQAIGSYNPQADSTNSQGTSAVPPGRQHTLICRESALDPWTPILFPPMQVALLPRQSVLVPRCVAMSPRQTMLLPRQVVLVPRQVPLPPSNQH